MVTFGADGITGHPDHIGVGAAATEAFHRVRETQGGGLLRLIHTALPQRVIDAWNERLVAAGKEPMDSSQLYVPGGVPDETVDLEVDTSSVVDACSPPSPNTARRPAAWTTGATSRCARALLRVRVVAWPPRAPGSPVLTDVFEGLRV